jgi:hypothetical protein
MDNGQLCYYDYEGQRRREFEELVRKANQVSNDDKLFEEEKVKVNNYVYHDKEFISNIDQHHGDVFYMAASIRRERDFFNKFGRSETILEFLSNIF